MKYCGSGIFLRCKTRGSSTRVPGRKKPYDPAISLSVFKLSCPNHLQPYAIWYKINEENFVFCLTIGEVREKAGSFQTISDKEC